MHKKITFVVVGLSLFISPIVTSAQTVTLPAGCTTTPTISCLQEEIRLLTQILNQLLTQRATGTNTGTLSGSTASHPTCSVHASANVIADGQPVTISWSSANAEYAVVPGGDRGPVKGSETYAPSASKTYVYTFYGPGGMVACSQSITVTGSGATGSGLSVDERNAMARAWGYAGEFGTTNGVDQWAAWRASGNRNAEWNTLVSKLTANPGDSVQEVYTLFPNMNPNFTTLCGVPKYQRDAKMRSLGFDGTYGVQDALGVLVTAGENAAWVGADASRTAAWNAYCPSATQANAAPTCTVTASKNIVTPGESVTLSWSSTNASSAIGPSGMIGGIPVRGSQVFNPTATTTYQFAFLGSGGTATCSQEIKVVASGLTPSGLSVDERNAMARAWGYAGEFGTTNGSDQWAAWRASGTREADWATLYAKLLANPGDSVQEIYTLFPNMDPNYMTACGVPKYQRDAMMRSLGFSGEYGVSDAQGNAIVAGENASWLQKGGLTQKWNDMCAAARAAALPAATSAATGSNVNLANALVALEGALRTLLSMIGQ